MQVRLLHRTTCGMEWIDKTQIWDYYLGGGGGELGVDRLEEAVKSAAQGADSDDNDNCDEANHDAVFDGGGTLFAAEAALKVEAEGVNGSDERKHVVLLSEFGWLALHQL